MLNLKRSVPSKRSIKWAGFIHTASHRNKVFVVICVMLDEVPRILIPPADFETLIV